MGLLQDRLNAANMEQPSAVQPNQNFMNSMRANRRHVEQETPEQINEMPKEPELSEEMLEAYEIKKARENKERIRRLETREKIVNILCAVICLYLIFLIYGVICTNYHYDETGKIAPQILSVEDIREGKKFDVVLVQYENCRVLYEKILMLDYRLGQGIENPLILAPEYEKILDEVQNLSIKINALDSDTKYEQIKNMMLSWVQNDTAIYLQKMSSAISQNNSEDASIALSYQTAMYNNFSLITENMVSMGEAIEGIDMTETKNWSPEKYIKDAINGK